MRVDQLYGIVALNREVVQVHRGKEGFRRRVCCTSPSTSFLLGLTPVQYRLLDVAVALLHVGSGFVL